MDGYIIFQFGTDWIKDQFWKWLVSESGVGLGYCWMEEAKKKLDPFSIDNNDMITGEKGKILKHFFLLILDSFSFMVIFYHECDTDYYLMTLGKRVLTQFSLIYFFSAKIRLVFGRNRDWRLKISHGRQTHQFHLRVFRKSSVSRWLFSRNRLSLSWCLQMKRLEHVRLIRQFDVDLHPKKN